MSSPSNKTEKDSKQEDLSSSIVNERIEALHCEMMDPSIIPRYLERAQLLWREAEQGHQSRTRDRSQSSLFSFSLSSYPWRLQIVSSSLADNAVSKTNEKDEVSPVQPANNHTDNRIFVDDPAIDYLELRRRQNQQWADQQYQTGIQAQAAGKIQAAQQAFVAGLELVPNHQALQQALQDLRQMASRRTQRSGMDSSAVPPPPSSGILRRSGLAQRSQQDALLEKSLLLSSNARRDKSVAGGEDSKYPLLPNDDDEDSSSSENTEERRRRRRKKREKPRKRKSKHEHKRRKRKRRYYDSSSDDDSSSESSNRKNSDSRDRRKRHKRRHHERSPAGSAEPQKDEQTAGDRTQEKKSPISKGDSNSRRKRRRRDEEQSRKHKRRKRGRRHRDDVDAASVCSNNDDDSGPSDRTVDSLKLIHVPHTKRRRQRKEDGY